MSTNFTEQRSEQRTGPRYLIALPVRAEWDDAEGSHVVVEGATENVGPEGTLVHLRQLPDLGSRVQLTVLDGERYRLQTVAEVLRIERNPGHPLAALQLIAGADEWRGLVWEPSSPEARAERGEFDEDEYEA